MFVCLFVCVCLFGMFVCLIVCLCLVRSFSLSKRLSLFCLIHFGGSLGLAQGQKTTFDGRRPSMEDYVIWNTAFDDRGPSMDDDTDTNTNTDTNTYTDTADTGREEGGLC